MRCIGIAIATALTLFIGTASGQTSIEGHNHAAIPVIDGATHPELISDLTAYRLYLVMVSVPANATDEQARAQAARISKLGLSDEDRQNLIRSLAKFNLEYHELVSEFNDNATTAWTHQERTDVRPFLLQRDNLVQTTHDMIRANLSGNGWALLDAHVLSEKRHMKISDHGTIQ